jgi:hypothetical protein
VVVTKKLVKFSVDLIKRIIFHTDSPRLKSANGRGKLMLLERKDQRKSARKKSALICEKRKKYFTQMGAEDQRKSA